MAKRTIIIPRTVAKQLAKLNDEALGRVIRIVLSRVMYVVSAPVDIEPSSPAVCMLAEVLEDYNDPDSDNDCADADFTEDDGGY